MLAVGIRRNNAGQIWKVAQYVIDSRLERRALSQIHRMAQELHIPIPGRFPEYAGVLRPAAIIHYDNRGRAFLGQAADQVYEAAGWPIGWDHYGQPIGLF
jgi:hypothetical protein